MLSNCGWNQVICRSAYIWIWLMASLSFCLILAFISYKLVVRLEASSESEFWGIYSFLFYSILRHTKKSIFCPTFTSAKPNGFSSSWLCFKFNWMEERDKKAHLMMLESWWNLDSWIGIWFGRENRDGVGTMCAKARHWEEVQGFWHGRRSGELEDIVRSDQVSGNQGFYMPWGISDVLDQSRQIRPDF